MSQGSLSYFFEGSYATARVEAKFCRIETNYKTKVAIFYCFGLTNYNFYGDAFFFVILTFFPGNSPPQKKPFFRIPKTSFF